MAKKKKPIWNDAEYPFDLAKCDYCLTQHARGMCHRKEHRQIGRAVLRAAAVGSKPYLSFSSRSARNPCVHKSVWEMWAESNLTICRRLRKRFARFYETKD